MDPLQLLMCISWLSVKLRPMIDCRHGFFDAFLEFFQHLGISIVGWAFLRSIHNITKGYEITLLILNCSFSIILEDYAQILFLNF